MKYIRTKDNIYEIINDYDETCSVKSRSKTKKAIGGFTVKHRLENCARADTIEELCDEFVGIDDGKPHMLRFVPYACAQYWNGGVYGAIWTNKGLIYVAKMNSKGEMELL